MFNEWKRWRKIAIAFVRCDLSYWTNHSSIKSLNTIRDRVNNGEKAKTNEGTRKKWLRSWFPSVVHDDKRSLLFWDKNVLQKHLFVGFESQNMKCIFVDFESKFRQFLFSTKTFNENTRFKSRIENVSLCNSKLHEINNWRVVSSVISVGTGKSFSCLGMYSTWLLLEEFVSLGKSQNQGRHGRNRLERTYWIDVLFSLLAVFAHGSYAIERYFADRFPANVSGRK